MRAGWSSRVLTSLRLCFTRSITLDLLSPARTGEWDQLATPDWDAMEEMERAIDDEFLRMKATVEAERQAKKAAKAGERAN